MPKDIILPVLMILFLGLNIFADCKAETPEKLIDLVGESFVGGDLEKFSCLFEIEAGRARLKSSIANNYQRRFDFGRVIRSDGKKASLLLMGLILGRNSGIETILSWDFTAIYEAERTEIGWKIKRSLPFKENPIISQILNVDVIPAEKLIIKDEITIQTKSDLGFAVTLNHKAKISKVLFNRKAAEYKFGGGLLWLNVKSLKPSRLYIEYELSEIDTDEKDANSSFWGKEFGHVRNQFFWHPFYDANSENGFAVFRITARIPKDFRLVTSFPQTEKVNGEYRIVTAESINSTPASALFYDKGWTVNSKKFGDLRFDAFVNASFLPRVVEMQEEFYRVYTELEKRFGKPVSNYFSVVQDRSRKGGWLFLTNQTVTAGNVGGEMRINQKYVRAPFAHEIAHAWTVPTGQGSNFLREGWASFAETYFIREKFGAEAEKKYFEIYRKGYEDGDFENKSSILADDGNDGVSYGKGLWIFKMLHDFVGQESFENGMKKYISDSRLGKNDINSFVASFAAASPKDVKTFLKPWLEGKVIPQISTRIVDGKIEIKQQGPIFLLPLEIEFETANGKIRKSFEVSKSTELFELDYAGNINNFKIDPDSRLLIKR